MTRILRRLAQFQATRPGAILVALLMVSAVCAVAARGLRIEGGFEHLLPDGRPSVSEYRRVVSRTAGVSTLFIVLEVPSDAAPAPDALRAASDTLVAELRLLGEPYVGSADNGVHDALKFLEPRAGLFLPSAEVEALHRDVTERWRHEVAKEADLLLEEDEAPPPPLDADSLRRRLRLGERDTFPGGYYQSADGRALAVVVRSKVPSSDAVRGREALRRIRSTIEQVDLASYDSRMRYGLAGDLYSGVVEVSALNDDLTDVGLLGAGLIALVVLLFYLRIRTLVVMLVTLCIGIVWTAGAARLAVGTLSIGTSFVFTIIAGNGLNTSVIFMARYLEARRDGVAMAQGLYVAHRETLVGTAAACAASSASFASLMGTSFRGFRDLGRLGAIGLVLCWIVTVLCLPALLALTERWFPMRFRPTDQRGFIRRVRSTFEAGFGKPFARLAARAPRLITVVGVGLGIVGFIALGKHLGGDPMEYDLGRLRNDVNGRAEMVRFKDLAQQLTQDVGAEGMAIVVDRVEQVAPLRAALNRIRDDAPAHEKPFEAVFALDDFVPDDQVRKIAWLVETGAILQKMRARGAVSDAAWRDIERYLPPDGVTPIDANNLPTAVARPFMESDGTRGRIVYIQPIESWIEKTETFGRPEDGRYLLRWAASYRATKLPDGSTVLGSGRAVIYADMLEGVIEAVPHATLAAILAVLLVTLIAFRRSRATLYVLGSLAVGIGWLAAIVVAFDIKLNFLNFVALPITFGIGVEYAVNVVYRYQREGRGSIGRVLRETGGAVVLCSATTILGYAALTGSINGAVRSLGVVAVVGEVCTLLSAMLVLPAFLMWRDGRSRARDALGAVRSNPIVTSS